MELKVYPRSPSARLADILSCIRSAPTLSSITFRYPESTAAGDVPFPHQWVDVDEWLARLAVHVETKESLTVVILQWLKGSSKWEECLPKFRKAGGQLRVEVPVFTASRVDS